ncbi:helix-turn-helix transcriptional regulator [Ideonella sp.]|jgi:HTH-type transcriptional regulator/antitoxin HipB|uniref:helix-turn-helix transcriptional regulator n=1 Tax=Ideonella sp. TaxID=1929293 RepID=UPI0037C155A2
MDNQTILCRIGSALQQARAQRGLTQGQLASRAGVTRQKVVQVEAGLGTVGAEYYAKLAGAMGLEFSLTPARKPTLDELQSMDLT